MKRHTKMLVGLLAGAVLGLIAKSLFGEAPWLEALIANVAYPLGQIFLRLIFMVVVPLVFSSLVLGVLEIGDVKQLGRVGFKALVYSLFASAASVIIGIALVQLVKPGAGIDAQTRDKLMAGFAKQSDKAIANAKAAKPMIESLLDLIPKNPLQAAVEALQGEMLALMVFAVLFAVAYSRVRDEENEALRNVLVGVQKASMRIIDWAMSLAPFAVGALLFSVTARTGFALAGGLGSYVLVVVLGLAIQQFVVFFAVLKVLGGVPPLEWWRRVREVVLTAFSTASSNATLPTSLRVSEEKLGVQPRIGTFVLTVGSTANQNGTALFEGVTVLFLAQVFGVDLTLGQQVSVVVMAILAGVGTAGVPGGSLPLIVLVLQSVGIPPEGIGIILGVDRFLDMCRTVINVTGDLVAATVIAKSENALKF
ncbi:MAG: dicarboxylate/amino acid:cation symporter [Deltaproteobacteria bacterium]|nr:dicarboxylate/amino acid:cation symporter [Deltaproteobacteria bacterium]